MVKKGKNSVRKYMDTFNKKKSIVLIKDIFNRLIMKQRKGNDGKVIRINK